MDDERDDDLDEFELEEDPEVDPKFHFATHGAMAVFALLSGVLSFLAVFALPISTLKRFFEETGVVLPAVTELVISWNLAFLSPALGLAAAIGIVALSTLKNPKLSWSLGLAALVVCFLPTSICVMHAMAMRYGMMESLLRTDDGRGELEPGRASEITREVVEGIRAGLRRGVGSFETPSGERRRYFVSEGPGLPKAPRELPPYAEARSMPGCVVLPWADALEPNLDHRREVMLLFPSGAQGGLAPKALEGRGEGDWVLDDDSFRYVTDYDTPVRATPATRGITNTDYSWVLVLRRARLDANGDGVVSAGASPWAPSSAEADPFSDRLLEVRIEVFRGFDPAATPTQPGEVMPPANTAQTAFITLVRLP
jgi:hypothetical protein